MGDCHSDIKQSQISMVSLYLKNYITGCESINYKYSMVDVGNIVQKIITLCKESTIYLSFYLSSNTFKLKFNYCLDEIYTGLKTTYFIQKNKKNVYF